MNILKLCYEFPPLGGGGAKVVQGVSPHLVRLGADIDLITMKYRNLNPYELVDGVHVHRVSCIRTRPHICYSFEMLTYLFSALSKATQLTKVKSYALNHTHFVFPDGIIAYFLKKRMGLPYLITIHGSDIPGYNPDRFTYQHKLLAPLWQKVFLEAEHVVSPSESLKKLALAQCSTTPISVIPNGINPSKFMATREKQNRILVVSRMFSRKGVQYFVEALTALNGRCEFEVNIVGDGPHLVNVKSLAKKIRTPVNFWGHLDNQSPELKDLFETSKIFVFPSEAENAPIVILEAMAAGLAIMTTEATGCAEMVGDTGVLVPPRNAEAIRTNLVRLMDNPMLCQRLGEAARARLEQDYAWEVIAARYYQLYEKLALSL